MVASVLVSEGNRAACYMTEQRTVIQFYNMVDCNVQLYLFKQETFLKRTEFITTAVALVC